MYRTTSAAPPCSMCALSSAQRCSSSSVAMKSVPASEVESNPPRDPVDIRVGQVGVDRQGQGPRVCRFGPGKSARPEPHELLIVREKVERLEMNARPDSVLLQGERQGGPVHPRLLGIDRDLV